LTDYPTPLQELISLEEMAKRLELAPYIISFWIRVFQDVGFMPDENNLFGAKEFNLAKLIKRLLYEEYFTLRGAKRRLIDFENQEKVVEIPAFPIEEKKDMSLVKNEINGLLLMLKEELAK
jgi:hypothetical protein